MHLIYLYIIKNNLILYSHIISNLLLLSSIFIYQSHNFNRCLFLFIIGNLIILSICLLAQMMINYELKVTDHISHLNYLLNSLFFSIFKYIPWVLNLLIIAYYDIIINMQLRRHDVEFVVLFLKWNLITFFNFFLYISFMVLLTL